MTEHDHILSGHHVATSTDWESWLTAIRNTLEDIDEARRSAHRIEDRLFPAKTRLLVIHKRIEEHMGKSAPVPEELERVAGHDISPEANLDKLLVRGIGPSVYLRRKDGGRIFFLEYFTVNSGMVLRDIDTKIEYYATVNAFADVADQWETVPEDEVYPDDEEEDGDAEV